MNVLLKRTSTNDEGTEGVLITPSFSCYTLELPWRDNKQSISCIPTGEYDVRIVKSPRFGIVYHITNVPNRSHVLIHSGNFAGDVLLGYKSHVEGCVLLGTKIGKYKNQKAILTSKVAVHAFMREMQNKPFRLTITEDY